jgi:transcriptional regulator with XRE-family HTH domain
LEGISENMSISLNISRLKECRETLGISKMEAAKRMQLSQPAYLRYESGARTPSIHTLEVIAQVLDTSKEYLLNLTDDPNPISYTISRKTDPELFEIIRLCKTSESDMAKRLTAYATKIAGIPISYSDV